jgi:hypothetical protein
MVCSKQSIRIATWNLERPSQNGFKKNQHRLDKIYEINADLWVFTETNSAICLEGQGYTAVESCPIQGYHKSGEHLTTIWSAWKVNHSILTFDPSVAVCAEVESPFGAMIIYGTVITYANDKGQSGTSKKWEEHRKSIRQHHQDWSRIIQQYPNHLICIAGDFNQSRGDRGWYEEKEAYNMLTSALEDLNLQCVTAKSMKELELSRASVDHICLSEDFKSRIISVNGWEGEKMSDHNGIFVELRC